MHPIVYFYPENHQGHVLQGHPERPERVEAIRAALDSAGWWQDFPKLDPMVVPKTVQRAVHTEQHLRSMAAASKMGGHVDMDTYITPESWNLALQAAGGMISVAASVWHGKARRGFSLSRPPGHHATPNQAMGFCLLNNIALAAEYLIQQEDTKRIAIIDLDVHHGNGTQDIFYNRGDVLFVSVHQSPLYPGTGGLSETGVGPGAGATLNLPLPPLSGDRAYQAGMDTVVLPLLADFDPEMLLVSAGFDSHWRDPLANNLVSAAGFGSLIGRLVEFADQSCQGRIALCLEGGYDLEGSAACALASTAALLDEPFDDPIGASPWKEGDDWRKVVARAREMIPGMLAS